MAWTFLAMIQTVFKLANGFGPIEKKRPFPFFSTSSWVYFRTFGFEIWACSIFPWSFHGLFSWYTAETSSEIWLRIKNMCFHWKKKFHCFSSSGCHKLRPNDLKFDIYLHSNGSNGNWSDLDNLLKINCFSLSYLTPLSCLARITW